MSTPMTPARWRAVDTILRAALSCEAERRAALVKEACGDDDALRSEVESLLAAHDGMAPDFLAEPAAAALAGAIVTPVPNERVAKALADALAGRYAIEREIARGGMATVYAAHDVRHDRRVAIKVMRDEVAAVVGAQRFLEEIRVTASLQHPHILPLFDSGSVGGLLWYVMPFIDGETLRSRLSREGRLPIDDAVRLAREVGEALDHAHARGIVHRDVKPENILLQGGHALVADFGIALALERAGGERLTRTGLTLGTPQYMAPEQASGERGIDARVDVYALGAVVHEMLAGEPPFAAESRQAVLLRILRDAPTDLASRRVDVSPSLDSAVRRALAKRPEDRFATAAAFAAAMSGQADRSESANPRLPAGANGARREPSSPRVVALRVALYAAMAGIVVGLVGGWGLANTSFGARFKGTQLPSWGPANGEAKALAADDAGEAAVMKPAEVSPLLIVDRAGKVQRRINANRPWTPRFSPDGRNVAYGAFGAGRSTSDIWVTDLDAGATRRLTNDDGDSNDPQWSPDGTVVAYSVNAPGGKDVAEQRLATGATRVVAVRNGTQFPSDWARAGNALLVVDDSRGPHQILMQPADGSPAWPYVAKQADERAARVSPDGHWIAFISDESGRAEVYVDSYPHPNRRVLISRGGGIDPAWRGDGRELYYWRGDALMAVQIGTPGAEGVQIGNGNVLFRAPYQAALNTMYDVSADGSRFVIVERPQSADR